MSSSDDLRLVVFDLDGTLVDSQHRIVAAMTTAFDAVDLPVPAVAQIHGVIGLSLETAIAGLLSEP